MHGLSGVNLKSKCLEMPHMATYLVTETPNQSVIHYRFKSCIVLPGLNHRSYYIPTNTMQPTIVASAAFGAYDTIDTLVW